MGRAAGRGASGDDAADPARRDRDRPHLGAARAGHRRDRELRRHRPRLLPRRPPAGTGGAPAIGVAAAARLGDAALRRGARGHFGGDPDPAIGGGAEGVRRCGRGARRFPADRAAHADRGLRLAGHRAGAARRPDRCREPRSRPRSSTRPFRSRPGARMPKPPRAAARWQPTSNRRRGFLQLLGA